MSGTTAVIAEGVITVTIPRQRGSISVDIGRSFCDGYYSSSTKRHHQDGIVKLYSIHDATPNPDELDPFLQHLQHLQYRVRGIDRYTIQDQILTVRLMEKFKWADVQDGIAEALRRYPFGKDAKLSFKLTRS